MRSAILATAAFSLALATGASAQSRPNNAPVRPSSAVPAKAPPAGGNSMGSTHASPRAIEVVCGNNTPAAERSAICRPAPVSRG